MRTAVASATLPAMSASSRVSPTAHYTAHVWVRHGLSDPALATGLGRVLYAALAPLDRTYERAGRTGLERMLLGRHRRIDALLERAVEGGQVGQVVEVAAGLSARGTRLSRRYRERGLVYVESDLPAMAARKLRSLEEAGLHGDNHHVVAVDALAEDGPLALAAATAGLLDPSRGTAVVTEGLLNYLPTPAVLELWGRVAGLLAGFPAGLYLTDLALAQDAGRLRAAKAFLVLLQAFCRGRVHLHFERAPDAVAAARGAGFHRVEVHDPAAPDDGPPRAPILRVMEAWLA